MQKNTMAAWLTFPHRGQFAFDRKSVRRHWARLHAGDQEALPTQPELLDAWALFHNGEFEPAFHAATALGAEGCTLANRATCAYAGHLEPDKLRRQELFQQVAERASRQIEHRPDEVNAHYLLAIALASYGQDISVAKGLAQGLGSKVKTALETSIRLQPLHAEAHIALGTFHADVIDKVGVLIAAMTYGAKREKSLLLFEQGLALSPGSARGLREYAAALHMLDGELAREQARELHRKAAAQQALDAWDLLHIEAAKASPLFDAP